MFFFFCIVLYCIVFAKYIIEMYLRNKYVNEIKFSKQKWTLKIKKINEIVWLWMSFYVASQTKDKN